MLLYETYADFAFPADDGERHVTHKVNSRDVADLVIPRGAFAFHFFTLVKTVVELFGEQVSFWSEALDPSPTYYIGGRVLTLDELRAEMPHAKSLIAYLQAKGVKRVVQTHGKIKPFGPKDIHLDERERDWHVPAVWYDGSR